jgi:hypothetical protein
LHQIGALVLCFYALFNPKSASHFSESALMAQYARQSLPVYECIGLEIG